MSLRSVCCLSVSVSLAALVSAPSARAAALELPPAPDAAGPARSPGVGLAVGAAATFAPLLLAFTLSPRSDGALTAERLLAGGAVVLGPSAGLFYAGHAGAATIGIVGRGLLLGGAVALASSEPSGALDIPRISVPALALATGAFVWAVVDVFRTPAVIRADNDRPHTPRVMLAPTTFSSGGGGLVAAGTF